MRRIILDGREFDSREKLHSIFKDAFNFPDYYGKNLDALHDCLSETSGVELQLRYAQAMISMLGSYGQQLMKLLEHMQEERPDFYFTLIQSQSSP